MNRAIAALWAALFAPLAPAQGGAHPHHSAPAASTQAPKPAVAQRPHDGSAAYRSAFSDYRPFSEELAPKAWRRANDEVREAGGHIGLMKGQPAQLQGHGAHGAKQPTPHATDRK